MVFHQTSVIVLLALCRADDAPVSHPKNLRKRADDSTMPSILEVGSLFFFSRILLVFCLCHQSEMYLTV